MSEYKELRSCLNDFRQLFYDRKLKGEIVKVSDRGFLKKMYESNNWTEPQAVQLYFKLKDYKHHYHKWGVNFWNVPQVKKQVSKPTPVKIEERIIGYKEGAFYIHFSYRRDLVSAVKRLPDRAYNNDHKYWTLPIIHAKHIRPFAKEHGFDIGETAQQMLANVDGNLDASYQSERVELDIDFMHPEHKLFDYQTAGVAYGIKNINTINADQMGLGKTIQGIGVMLGLDTFPCMVVCPKSLRYNWKSEWEAWTNKKVMILDKTNVNKLHLFIEAGLCDVAIINYEGIKTFFLDKIIKRGKGDQLVLKDSVKIFKGGIVDEAHECRNFKTTKFKAVKQAFKHMKARVLLTGTPVVNKASDMAALLDIIGRLDEFGGRFKFVTRYKDIGKGAMNVKKKGGNTPEEKDLQELNMRLRSTCFIRREKFQVLTELPDKFRQMISVDLDNRAEYDLAYISLQEYLARKGESASSIAKSLNAEMLVRINVLKQISARGKMYALKRLVHEIIESGEKVVVFCWFLNTVTELKKEFENTLAISGQETDEQIDSNKKLFQNDPDYPLMVVSYKRGGVGHTLTAASKVILFELGWNDKDQSQAEDRLHRIGQKDTVNAYYLLGKDTIDEYIYDIIEKKRHEAKHATGSKEEIQTSMLSSLKNIITDNTD